jgi:hypothetical protein
MSQNISFREAFRFWLKLGFISFGGPAGQIVMRQKELVENRQWIEQDDFLHALNFCILRPEAQQLATYIGWRRDSESRADVRRDDDFPTVLNQYFCPSFGHYIIWRTLFFEDGRFIGSDRRRTVRIG